MEFDTVKIKFRPNGLYVAHVALQRRQHNSVAAKDMIKSAMIYDTSEEEQINQICWAIIDGKACLPEFDSTKSCTETDIPIQYLPF